MSNEIRLQVSLQVKASASSLVYQSQPTAFNIDMAGSKGPTPGAIKSTVAGTEINLSQLDTLGGMCRIMNLDLENKVTVGIWNPSIGKFHPIMDILAGESYVIRLSTELGAEYGTGTGSVGDASDQLMVKAWTSPCNVLVEAFDL